LYNCGVKIWVRIENLKLVLIKVSEERLNNAVEKQLVWRSINEGVNNRSPRTRGKGDAFQLGK
jgi:hypothetical protein